MPSSIIGSGSGQGRIQAVTANDITFTGYIIRANTQTPLTHANIVNGKAFQVTDGKFCSVLVILTFNETGEATVTCNAVDKKKSVKRSATVKKGNPVVKQVQFDIYP